MAAVSELKDGELMVADRWLSLGRRLYNRNFESLGRTRLLILNLQSSWTVKSNWILGFSESSHE